MKWNVDPEIVRFGPLAIRYYSLLIVIGFITMSAYTKTLFKKEGKNPEDVSNLTTYIIFGMLIGARLAHCLFYDPGYYFSNPIKILYVWEGGLASHGGYVGVLIAVYLFLKKHRDHQFLHLMDMIAGPCLFVGGLIRIGNLMNSEIYGIPTQVPWAVIFERVDSIPRHPSQIYESIGYLTIAFILAYLYKTKKNIWKQGCVLAVAIVLSFTFRFLVEFTKDEQATFMHNPSINMGQWLSVAFVAGGIFLFAKLRKSA